MQTASGEAGGAGGGHTPLDLRGLAAPDVIVAGDPRYDSARRIWNGLIDRRPAVIVCCRSVDDVMAALRFAREHGLPLSVRGGGHNVAGKSLVDGGVVIDLGAMRDVTVEPATRIVRVGGGARLSDVDGATSKYGLVVPLGLVGATGVAGFTLHGGYGWLARKHGLALDSLLAVEMVTADGRFLRASDDQNPELFWAVRGGGGNFGIVTAFEFRGHPIPDPVWMGMTYYAVTDVAERIGLLAEAARSMPDEVGILGTLWSLADEAPVPAGVRGLPVLGVLACYAGPAAEGERVTSPLRNLGPVVLDTSGALPFTEVQRLLDADYPDGRLYYWKSIYLPALPEEAIALLGQAAAARPSPHSSVDIWFLDGAVGRVAPTATAFSHRTSPYLIGIEACWDPPPKTRANIEWARELYASLEPLSSRETYLNFAGFGEDVRGDLMRGAYGPNYNRLKEAKRRYDPENVFQSTFNVAP